MPAEQSIRFPIRPRATPREQPLSMSGSHFLLQTSFQEQKIQKSGDRKILMSLLRLDLKTIRERIC
jgi:hypothetical protein